MAPHYRPPARPGQRPIASTVAGKTVRQDRPKIETYGGRIAKSMGDGLVVQFASVIGIVLSGPPVASPAFAERASRLASAIPFHSR